MGVGGEGFYGAGNPLVTANPEFPAQTWPQQTGQVGSLTRIIGLDVSVVSNQWLRHLCISKRLMSIKACAGSINKQAGYTLSRRFMLC